MKVYISGKIGEDAISTTTLRKFEDAKQLLEASGHDVFNPACSAWQEHLKERYDRDKYIFQPYTDGTFPSFYGYCLLRDLMALALKDAIYMLPDWMESHGARVEHDFALALGKKVIYADEETVL